MLAKIRAKKLIVGIEGLNKNNANINSKNDVDEYKINISN